MGDVEFVCILWGNKYSPIYVSRLRRAIRASCSFAIPFVCLTDRIPSELRDHPDIEFRKSPNSWPGWWQKINLFNSEYMPRRHVIYLDLDVVILRTIDPIVKLVGTREFFYAQDPLDVLSSSLMVIDTQSQFSQAVKSGFDPSQAREDDGDQDYLKRFIRPDEYDVAPLPASVHFSYKCFVDYQGWGRRSRDPRYAVSDLEEIMMFNFHGYPKPLDIFGEPDRWVFSEKILKHWS